MLSSETSCNLEDLLKEDEHVVNQCRASNPKLIEFMCQKETLAKLIEYATSRPEDIEDHNRCHK